MPLGNDLYSVTVVDATSGDCDESSVSRRLRNVLVDYFNLGVNEYRYPEDSLLGDVVQSTVRDLNATDSGLTSVPYGDLDDSLGKSQAIFIVGNPYTSAVDSLVRRYRGDHYIDFERV